LNEKRSALGGALIGGALIGFYAGFSAYLLGLNCGFIFVVGGLGSCLGGFFGLGCAIWAFNATWK